MGDAMAEVSGDGGVVEFAADNLLGEAAAVAGE